MNRLSSVFCGSLILVSSLTAQWSSDPTINTPVSTAAGDQIAPVICSDGSSGAIIAWQDKRNGASTDIYAQRIDSTGVVKWTIDGIAVSTADSNQNNPAIASDGAGGAIIVWQDYRADTADIYAQRINGNGIKQWADSGVAISTATGFQLSPIVISDGTGGAIIAWTDYRTGLSNQDLYAQRVNSAGVVVWTANGVSVCNAAGSQANIRMTSDDTSGAIFVWEDYRSNTSDDVYAQRIDSSGSAKWNANGIPIRTTSDNQLHPAITSDGAGGAFIVWEDWGGATYLTEIYGQRVSGNGSALWGSYHLMAVGTGNDTAPSLIDDGTNGMIMTWTKDYDVYALRFTQSGDQVWAGGNLAISTAAGQQLNPVIIKDGTGGAIITWRDHRLGVNIYSQRITASGSLLWKKDGALVVANQDMFSISGDGTGGAVTAFYQFRSADYNVYAQNIHRLGNIGVSDPSINSITDIPDDLGGKVRVSWNKSQSDTSSANFQVVSYSLWRKVPGFSAIAKANIPTPLRASLEDSLSNYEFVASVPAIQTSTYNVVVPTLEDSSAAGIRRVSFLVTAQTSKFNVRYLSDPDSGYSVNNFGIGNSSTTLPLAKSDPVTPLDLSLANISDVPNDQGGQVRLRWSRSAYEDSAANQIINYCVWRKIIDVAPSQIKPNAQRQPLIAESLSDFDYVTTVPAVQIPYYNAVVPSLSDSSATGMHRFTYVVTAHTGNVNTYFDSPPDSGFSVDNLAPSSAAMVSASLQSGPSVNVHWSINNTDSDVKFYEVHRDTTDDFIPALSTKIGQTTDTSFVDSNPSFSGTNYYRIVTVDVHDNHSPASPQAAVVVASTVQYTLRSNWNIVSVSLTVGDYNKTSLYPSAISNAFAYSGSYVNETVLSNGRGYWIKFDSNQSVGITGIPRSEDTISVLSGWNLIGSISTPVATSGISSNPPGMITGAFFGYSGSYIVVDSVEPGSGYWVKVNTDGELILSSSASAPTSRIKIVPTSELPPAPPEASDADNSNLKPKAFALDQNFPNPFNPTTVIRYAIPNNGKEHSTRVQLRVYDVLGQEVAVLVNETQEAGYKSVTWDASNLPSGIYFYCLQTSEYRETRKLLLMK